MWAFIKRWFRSWTSPWPMVGQTWYIEGIGVVMVVTTPRGSPRRSSEVMLKVLAGELEGQKLAWTRGTLMDQGEIVDLNAEPRSFPKPPPPPPPSPRQEYEPLQDFSLDEITKLLSLCHPDKHDNSDLSNDITAWLLDKRGRR